MKLNRRNIEILMCKNQITRQQVAENYGCNVARVSAILNCKNVRPVTAQRFADALGVSLESILSADE